MDKAPQFGISIPFVEHLGIQLVELNRERAVVSLKHRPELRNSWGKAHGGVIMTMLDLVMSMAVRGHHGSAGAVLTVDISVGFLNPAEEDILAEGRVLNSGRSTVFCESEARGADGRILAKGIGTFRLLADRKNP